MACFGGRSRTYTCSGSIELLGEALDAAHKAPPDSPGYLALDQMQEDRERRRLVAYCLVAGKTKWKIRFRSEETKVKKLVSITAILLYTVAVACSGQPPNPLLGKWKIVPRSGDLARYDTYCATSMVF